MEYQDYYKILGVNRSASPDEIKRAYKKLARKYHPDVSKEPNATERFKEINEAYQVLHDAKKRAAYDQLGSNWQAGQEFKPPPGWNNAGFSFERDFTGDENLSDFFDALFGGGRGFHQQHRTYSRMRGEDVHAKIAISLEDAYRGATRAIQIQIPEITPQGFRQTKLRTLNVKIPAGVMPGQKIRLAGQGEPGPAGKGPGDLYLEIELLPHSLFRLDGHDVYLNLPITPWEAALGAKIVVPTLDGKVDIKIPPGSQTGQKLRLKGRGMPGKVIGDQYNILQIMTPKAETVATRELYETMAKAMPFNPRRAWEA